MFHRVADTFTISRMSKTLFQISVWTIVTLMIFATAVMFKEIEEPILRSCSSNPSDETGTSTFFSYYTAFNLLEGEVYCKAERKALSVFSIFLLVRVASYKLEELFLIFCRKCAVRKLISGHRIGIGPGILFFARELLWPFADETIWVILTSAYAIVFIVSTLIIYPYFQDLYNVYQALQVARRSDFFFERHHSLVLTMIAMVSYAVMVSLLFIESITNRAAEYFQLLGYRLSYPYVNYSLIIYLLHSFILRTHFRHRRIYLIKDQNRMLRVEIAICLNGCTCIHNTTVEADPPGTTTEGAWIQQKESLAAEGQLVSVNSYLDVEPWLVQKIKNQLQAR